MLQWFTLHLLWLGSNFLGFSSNFPLRTLLCRHFLDWSGKLLACSCSRFLGSLLGNFLRTLLYNFLRALLDNLLSIVDFLHRLSDFLSSGFLSLLEPQLLNWRDLETSRPCLPCISARHKGPCLNHLLHSLF